jgi:hypothetical protein
MSRIRLDNKNGVGHFTKSSIVAYLAQARGDLSVTILVDDSQFTDSLLKSQIPFIESLSPFDVLMTIESKAMELGLLSKVAPSTSDAFV